MGDLASAGRTRWTNAVADAILPAMANWRRLCTFGAFTLFLGIGSASAQTTLGTFNWQLQPYCNVVTVQVTQEGATYRLAGWETVCGVSARQGVHGTVSPNLDGSLTFLLVTANANGTQVHTSVRFDVQSLGGSWSDSAGNTGAFVLGASTGGAPRSLATGGLPANSVTTSSIVDGTVGGADVNSAQVQLRVTGACAAGESMQSVAASGAVVCAPTQPASPAQIVWVAKAGGNYTTVQAALAAITDASASKPYVIRVAPGIYLEPSGLVMKNFVDIVGSGTNATTIQSGNVGVSATVRLTGAVTVELRDVSILNAGGSSGFSSRAILVDGAAILSLLNVSASASGTASSAYGVDTTGAGGTVTIRGSNITAGATSGTGAGINVGGSGAVVRVFDSRLSGPASLVEGTGSTARLANTMVNGNTSGLPACFNVFTLSFTPYTCQ
jgi:hypothetical protein